MENFEENLNKINQRLDGMAKLLAQVENKKEFETPELGELFTALAKAQAEMEVAKLDSTNPFFKSKYADLSSVVKASRPYLAKNGLCIIQRVVQNGSGIRYLYTRLCHTSGQWMESKMIVEPPKNDIQTVGSYITYLRRYNYASMVGVVAAEEDDDGEGVMDSPRKENNEIGAKSTITKAQLEVLANELEGHEEILEALLKGYQINKLANLPAKKYTSCLHRIKEVKNQKES